MALEAVDRMGQSNVCRQLVVDCWSSNRKRTSSEFGTDARDGQQRSTGRAHRSSRRRDGEHVVEVQRRGRRQHLMGQHSGLVRNAVLHQQQCNNLSSGAASVRPRYEYEAFIL